MWIVTDLGEEGRVLLKLFSRHLYKEANANLSLSQNTLYRNKIRDLPNTTHERVSLDGNISQCVNN